jgi:hypothetical protein
MARQIEHTIIQGPQHIIAACGEVMAQARGAARRKKRVSVDRHNGYPESICNDEGLSL